MRVRSLYAAFLLALAGSPADVSVAQVAPKSFAPTICSGATGTAAKLCAADGNGGQAVLGTINPTTHKFTPTGSIADNNIIPITMYGGKCDGVTDNATAIAAAIAAGGGNNMTVQFPRGTCLSSPITINQPGITLEGAGQYATTLSPVSSMTSGDFILITQSANIHDIQIAGANKAINLVHNHTAITDLTTAITEVYFASVSSPGACFVSDGAPYNIANTFFNSCDTGISNQDFGTGAVIGPGITVLGGTVGIVLSNNGHSDEGIIVHDSQILPTSKNAIALQINHCLECYIHDVVLDTPGQTQANGGHGVLFTGSASYIKIHHAWVGSGIDVESGNTFLSIDHVTFENGSTLILNPPSFGAISNYDISNNNFQSGTTGQQIYLFNTVNGLVHHNKGALGVYENGGSHVLFESNMFGNMSCTRGIGVFVFNLGGASNSTCANNSTYPTAW